MDLKLSTIILVYLIHLHQTLAQENNVEDRENLRTLKKPDDNQRESHEPRLVTGGKIVDIELSDTLLNYTIKIPSHCENKFLCEDFTDYPEKEIAKIVKKYYKHIQDFFIKEPPIPKIDRRNNERKNYLCNFTETLTSPTFGKLKGKYELLLNTNQKIQSVNIVQCSRRNSDISCFEGTENEGIVSSDSGYKTFCKEQHMSRTMIYLDKDRKEIRLGYFYVSICCMCMIQEIPVKK